MSPHIHGDDCGYYRHCPQCGYPLMVHRNKTDPCTIRIGNDDECTAGDDA